MKAFFSLPLCSVIPPPQLTMDWHSSPGRVTPLLERLIPLPIHRKTSNVATGVLGISGWIWCPETSYWDVTSQGESNRPTVTERKKAVCVFFFELWEDPVREYILDTREKGCLRDFVLFSATKCEAFKEWNLLWWLMSLRNKLDLQSSGDAFSLKNWWSEKYVLFVWCIPVLVLIKLQILVYILLEKLKLHCKRSLLRTFLPSGSLLLWEWSFSFFIPWP